MFKEEQSHWVYLFRIIKNLTCFRLNCSQKTNIIMFVHKKSSVFFFKQNYDYIMRENRLFNIKILYSNTSVGQNFINSLDLVNLNSFPIDIKIYILNDNINVLFNGMYKCLIV